MVICKALLCSYSGSITKRSNETDGHFVARPKGILEVAHSCVATFDKDWAIACKLRLTVNYFEDS